ncbi:LpqB family beta-propeller domain-containing protein [Nocardioides sp. zg-1228]|uniref:LpqB family beta-propeller domain-containing protein n=1 Tax=Nocardioides sp. zg-1228 TaxID=2763008 RepID=UPI0016431E51|nr:LpqB family beta-propeller domain-containing protein [Nocardioides sp. zg-1228]MBC2933865.1 GerMN domain-containing protein [Nocardioides sp. zg-1228]QSF58632.1 GerMN domain-containing protein [Nocardioides sp. zg-1228]
MNARRAVRTTGAVAVAVLLAGCVRMPVEGPVVESEVTTDSDDAPGISYDPRPPQAGESPGEIVDGFFEAMKATPVSPTVARQFLSNAAAEAWAPEQQIMTYAELGDATAGTSVRVPLTEVNRYDVRGSWKRTQGETTVPLRLVEEGGEWRIDEVPDALIVPDSWFDDWYERASLYYFDPATEVLVPEPVFVPRGEQFASSLVRGLLTGSAQDLRDVTRSYFPPGTTHGLVPITSGIAEVSLSGDPDAVDELTAQRMLAQLVWTLRQEPRISAVQLSIGGRAIAGPSGSPQVSLQFGGAYDPNGVPASTDLFALDTGRVVSGRMDELVPTAGPLGQEESGYDLRSIGVSLTGSRVAGVTATGTELVLAPTDAPSGEVATVVVGAADLAAPHWDYRDRIWVLDRGNGRARVIQVVDGVAGEVVVPGLSGRRVTDLVVSRDGTRLVGVVRGRKVDRVVSVRLRHDAAGAVIGFTEPQTLALPAEGSARIRDVGWRSPTTVSVLSVINDDYSDVRTLAVDGAPGEIAAGGATLLRGPTRVLVSSPADGEVYALAGRAVTSVTRPERAVPDLPQGLRALTYVG